MERIRYIHAADLHIDKPFSGLDCLPDKMLANELHEAAYNALNNFIQLCIAEQPDFVVMAGDIYDQEEHGIKAQLRIRDACSRLNNAGIPVFIAHGNHDPLNSRLSAIEWPEGTHIFGSEPQKKYLEKNGENIALIHGISHAATKEGRNLAKMFARDPQYDGFQLGVLHCNVDGSVANDRYAPCSLQDLLESGLDAWALGHAHKRQILCEKPLIAYSGNLQGQNSRETGPKGAYLVEAQMKDGQWQCETSLLNIAPILWQSVEIAISPSETLNNLYEKIHKTLSELASEFQNYRAILVSLVLEGQTDLDAILRKEGAISEIQEELSSTQYFTPPVWVKSITLNSSPIMEAQNFADRDDLLGQIFRICSNLENNPTELDLFVRDAISDLHNGRRLSGILPFPNEKDQEKILLKAQSLCCSVLENK